MASDPPPTTPATAEQLREDARHWREVMCKNSIAPSQYTERWHRLRAAIEAARREAQHAELRGWGAMRPDGTFCPLFLCGEVNDPANVLWPEGATAVPVRLTTEVAE